MLIYIFVILIILLIFYLPINEYFGDEIISKPHIKLYENFNQKNMVFNFEPILEDPTALYLRKTVKINVKSIDLNLPEKRDGFDDLRTVEIWNIYDGDNTASSESDFYNSYTEPDFARRANSSKYKLLVKLKAGSRIKINIGEPVKKIFLYARL